MIDPATIAFFTFLLAMLAFIALVVTISADGRLMSIAWATTALLATTHVLLVWAYRYEWQLAQATRNGYVGFLVFHTALLLIVAAPIAGGRAAMAVVRLAFLVVTVGAVGAVFRYDEVSPYRIPVLFVGLAGCLNLFATFRRKTSEPTDQESP